MSYTCPNCGKVSHNPNDETHRYCGACHRFEGDRFLQHYILDHEHQPVATDFLSAAVWWEDPNNRLVAFTETALHEVSTIFLTFSQRHIGRGPPLLFETMVFENGESRIACEQVRYSSWDEAQAGHAAMVRRYEKLEADASAHRLV